MRGRDRLDHYCYVFLDQRKPGKWIYEWKGIEHIFNFEPFYVGRGLANRMKTHFEPLPRKKDNLKNRVINKIEAAGLSVIAQKIFEDLTFDESQIIEMDFVKKFGRRDLKQGPLTNRTNGGWDVSFRRVYIPVPPGTIRYSRQSKRVDQFTLDGNFIKKWDTVTEAAKGLNLAPGNISACCYGKIETSQGFIWKFDGTSPYTEPLVEKISYKTRPVFQYRDQKFIERFNSVKEAGEKTGLLRRSISGVASGRSHSLGGCQWFFEDQGELCAPLKQSGGRPRPISQFNLDGVFIATYKSVRAASKATGISQTAIKTAADGIFKPTRFLWKYE